MVALLSISSKPSRIAGFGEQCMPVLSFHTPNPETQQLDPVPWGAPRTAPRPAEEPTEEAPAQRRGREKRPAASGRKLDAAALDRREREWLQDPVVHAHVPLPQEDAYGAHLLCAVPAFAGGGVLVFCEKSIVYVPPPAAPRRSAKASRSTKEKRRMSAGTDLASGAPSVSRATQKRRKVPESDADACRGTVAMQMPKLVQVRAAKSLSVCAATVVDDEVEQGTLRVLFSTSDGHIYTLSLYAPGAQGPWEPTSIKIARIGASSVPAGPQGLTYLGEGFVHISSATGDAVLLHLAGDGVAEAHRWPNLGPVVDFAMDHGESDQLDPVHRRMITCSGAGPTSSLRIFWNGVATSELTHLAVPQCLRVCAIDAVGSDVRETKLLALLFATHTKVVQCHGLVDTSSALAERGVALDERALHVCTLASSGGVAFVLITAHAVYAVYADRVVHWPSEHEIVVADANEQGSVLLGLEGGRLLHLGIREKSICVERAATVDSDIATVCLPGPCSEAICVVGLWEPTSFALYTFPELEPVAISTSDQACSALPIAVLVYAQTKDTPTYILVALSSGDVLVHTLTRSEHHTAVRLVHTLSLGGRPAELVPFAAAPQAMGGISGGIVALGQRSYILFPEGDRLRYSALRYTDLRSAAPLTLASDARPVLACVATEGVRVLSLDNLHENDIRTTSLDGQHATAIAEYAPAKAYAVTTFSEESGAEGIVRLVSRADLTTLGSYTLLRNERPNCVASVTLDGTPYIVVGTGFQREDQLDTVSGRLMGFRWDGELQVVFALDVPGNVYGVAGIAGMLVAAVNAQVNTYALGDQSQKLRSLDVVSRWGCSFIASCLARSTEDEHTIVIGDAMRSLTVLWISDDGEITELGRDLDPYWTTAVAQYDAAHQQYLGSDIAMNMFVAGRVPTKAQGQFGHAMRRVSCFHYGDMVNKLVQSPPELGRRTHFCTAAGALGVVCEVEDEASVLLDAVQQAMAQETIVPGDIPWDEWRTLRTDHRIAAPTQFLDGELLALFLECTLRQRSRVVAVASHLARRKHGSSALSITVDSMLRALDRLSVHT